MDEQKAPNLKYGDKVKVKNNPSKLLIDNEHLEFYEGAVGTVVGKKGPAVTILFLPDELRGVGDLTFFKDLLLQAFRPESLEKI